MHVCLSVCSVPVCLCVCSLCVVCVCVVCISFTCVCVCVCVWQKLSEYARRVTDLQPTGLALGKLKMFCLDTMLYSCD